ncbi:MAG: M28 family peptidase [Bacteroidales bacterium]|nr:M28 family peptidase [Bacteroidales bacterium]
MKEDVEYLSSTLLKGRGFGSCGAVEASWYVLRRFDAAGLDTSVGCFKTAKGVGHNIIGIHRGNPKSSSYVLVMAYFDGMGMLGDDILPGADANASGVAVLLALADSLAGSRSNYIFAALDGHNADRAGAEALCDGPWKLSMAVNIDIIGSTLAPPNKYRPDFLIVLGGEKFEKQKSKEFDKLNEGTGLRLYYDYYRSKSFTDYFYNTASDQAPFLLKGIPAVMFTSGITMNTNKPEDSFDTLDYEVMARRSDFILNWLKTL